MRNTLFRRALGAALALALMLGAAPAALAAEKKPDRFQLIQLVATDVTLDETNFEYTGKEIKPNVTVTAGGKTLTLGKDYTLQYADNVEVGTGKVIVTGIATASPHVGYTGTVEHPFFINEKAPQYTLLEIKDKNVSIEADSFPYTGSEIKPGITVTVDGKTLTEGKDYSLSYVNNIEVGTGTAIISGIATASETLGYTGQVKVNFSIVHSEESYPLVELKKDHVTLEGTKFEYTGKEIQPKVTVTVDGKVLTAGRDYSVEYRNNTEVGTASAIIRGIATATENGGYTGEVTVNFTIVHSEQSYPLVELKKDHIALEGTKFEYTGKEIQPKVTVTVDGKVLTAGRDYSIEYRNNTEVGTASAIIRGIATATENGGYTGEVTVNFTIVHTEDSYPLTEIKGTDVTIDGTEFTYTGKAIEPKITVKVAGKVLTQGRDYTLKFENNIEPGTATAIISGIATATENGGYTGQVKINFTIVKAPQYKITKGDGGIWYQGTKKNLSFTADGNKKDFTKLTVDGKTVASKYYTVTTDGTVVTLKASFLEKLALGKHTVAIHFADGAAEGTFSVSDQLDTTNPTTGDMSNIGLWTSMMLLSLAGTAVLLTKRSWKA